MQKLESPILIVIQDTENNASINEFSINVVHFVSYLPRLIG
jgi:hypothetical protein